MPSMANLVAASFSCPLRVIAAPASSPTLKPSCLISWSQPSPDGTCLALVGRQGRYAANIWRQMRVHCGFLLWLILVLFTPGNPGRAYIWARWEVCV